jgi:hypothetical protein
MSVRGIASVGVFLCAAMMSFAIYLGVVEHVYAPLTVRAATLVSQSGRRQSICVATQHPRNTSTTDATTTTVEACRTAQALAAK